MNAVRLDQSHFDEAVAVLADAFHDYPVMRYVLGPDEPYEPRLDLLVSLFAAGRFLRAEPVFGIRDPLGALIAVATTTPPGDRPAPQSFIDRRESTWTTLGPLARARYEAFAAACNQFAIPTPHHHINMIGVRRTHHGRGLARALLESVHAMAAADPNSTGVSLTTEYQPNLGLYTHFGYHIEGHARVSDILETWTLFHAKTGQPSWKK